MNIENFNNYFFVGIAGSGMSAIAQYLKGIGKNISGSDREFSNEKQNRNIELLIEQGIACFPQNATGIDSNTELLVISTAIEEDNVEYLKSKQLGIPIVLRSDLLAAITRSKKTVAIAGTSGKSTTVAMLFHILHQNNFSPSLITGAGLASLQKNGEIGNSFVGKSDWLIIEADESDGSLVKYTPEIGVILNIDKDHKTIDELVEIFTIFKNNSSEILIVNQDQERTQLLNPDGNFNFGTNSKSKFCAKNFKQIGFSILFEINGIQFEIPTKGNYNMMNAVAAVSAANYLGISILDASKALINYEGIYRRNQLIGEKNGVQVIDDFAHNPVKIAAAIRANQPENGRLFACFQPHGYAPTRFLRNEFVEEITNSLRADDEILMPEIYYAGGTANKNISANDLIIEIKENGKNAHFFEDRLNIIPYLKAKIKANDIILITGARDPSLDEFARKVFEQI